MSVSKLTCSGGAARSCSMSSEGGDGGSNCDEDQSISGKVIYMRQPWTLVLYRKSDIKEIALFSFKITTKVLKDLVQIQFLTWSEVFQTFQAGQEALLFPRNLDGHMTMLLHFGKP